MDVGVLGSLEVRLDDGSAVPIRAPKLQALLVALVLERGRTVPSERLVEVLWAEDPPAQPLAPLRSYVSNLRRLLGDEAGRVVAAGRGYRLDLPPGSVDALVFEDLASQARRALREGQPAAAVELLDEALGLWRGPALVDLDDRDVVRPAIVRLEELRVTAAEDRLEARLLLGHHDEVVAELEQLIAHHPLRERPRRLLLLALHAAGRTPDALAAHARFREHLAEELGLDPSPELEALVERILRQDPILPAAGRDLASPAPAGTPPARPAEDRSGLVGRRRERAVVAQAVGRLAEGAGSVLLLAGEPGIGKSTLLHEVVAEAGRRDTPSVWGRCVETGGAPAFWPWVQALRGVVDGLDDATLAATTTGPAGAVSHLVPEIADRTGRPVPPVGGEGAAARFAVYDAVTTFLRRVAERRGLVVVVDDLHWGDPASCELAAFLGTHVADVPLVLAVSHRTVAADRTPELDEAIGRLLALPSTTALELAGLSEEEVGELVAGVLGSDASHVDVADLHARAGGNPFFVSQLAQLAAESTHADDHDRPLPQGLRHVILRRLHRLPGRSRETLEAAAVLGRDIDPALVARCTGRPLADVLDDLDGGAAHGLVVPPATPGGAHRFVHALVREAIDRDLPAGRALRWHVAAADTLEALPRPPTHAVAEHLWHAASLVPVERVVRWLCRAADESVAVFAHEQAERSLQRALRLLITATTSAPALELTVRLRLVQVLTALRGWTSEEIGEVAAPARELAGTTGIGVERLSLWWSLWTLYTTRGDLEEGRALARQLLTDAEGLGRPESLVAGHVAVGYSELFTGAPTARVLDHLERAAAAESRADPEVLGATPEHLGLARLVSVAMAHALDGRRDEATAGMAAAVAMARGLGSPFAEGYARMFAGWGAAVVDDAAAAAAHADAGVAVCEQVGLSYLAIMITPVHAWAAAVGRGDASAAGRLREAVDALAAVGHRHALPFWRLLLADVLARTGDDEAAEVEVEAAVTLATATGERLDGPLVRRVVGTRVATLDVARR